MSAELASLCAPRSENGARQVLVALAVGIAVGWLLPDRHVLGHAVLSFAYNAVILALALNLLFGVLA